MRSAHFEIDRAEPGLAYCSDAASDAAPRYMESDRIVPARVFGVGEHTTLKASFWECAIEETGQVGDPDFVSIALHTGGGRAWRNREPTPNLAGGVGMQPFEGATWRFEPPLSFVQIYVPFSICSIVCESLFDRELKRCELIMLMGERDEKLCSAVQTIQAGISRITPTNLILDSWALILADILLQRFSSHSQRRVRASFGKLPERSIARVVDYVESSIDRDLDLRSLANIAAMSSYHFARRFKETVGVSPHAYVLMRRVRRAVHLLERKGLSLAQIAAACGFSSQAHFTTAFRTQIGVTPSAYRRVYQT